MTHLDDDDETRKALATLGAGPAAAELYGDLLRPAARELGANLQVIAKLITAALSPLHAMVWGIDRVRDWLSAALLQRLAAIPSERIESPKAYIAGEILLHLPFCADQEHLRDLYANLLAAAMDRSRSADVHPAFIHVIQQLTPDEAVLLLRIAKEKRSFSISDQSTDRGYEPGHKSVSQQFQEMCLESGLSDATQSDGYLDNLIRLRIFAEVHWNEGEYIPPGEHRHGTYEGYVENKTGRVIELSVFGEKFLSTCVRNLTQ